MYDPSPGRDTLHIEIELSLYFLFVPLPWLFPRTVSAWLFPVFAPNASHNHHRVGGSSYSAHLFTDITLMLGRSSILLGSSSERLVPGWCLPLVAPYVKQHDQDLCRST
ncbi:hypothetical protein AG1IA_01519 [Rhizoctonia solani AG-1 IA]|uniref:Uncharacterized protein n=1 Tax=Thanatephorus cucumeris (strain AG1-IA) TaxID=983506 RepID=L8X2I5_THACA|nr:hypothetical protein AG1IA_01519 [Rhizoctonia solani AG-1 IA]